MGMPAKPYTRWTADTQTAFVLALQLHGTVRAAAGVVGRSVTSAYKVRERDAAFAARWAEAVAAQQAAWIATQGSPAAVPREGQERRDGWTDARRARFLRELARTGSVAEGCAAVGLSTTAARQHRRRSAKFAAAWDRALSDSRPSPLEAAYARAVEGWLEPVVFQGQVVAHKRRYSDTALRLLIQREMLLAGGGAPSGAGRPASRTAAVGPRVPEFAKREDTDRVILDQLDVIEAERKRYAREAAVEFTERWCATTRRGEDLVPQTLRRTRISLPGLK